MANPTMTLIGSPVVVGSGGVSSVTFSSIPATYTDLIIKMSARVSYAASRMNVNLQLNGSSASIYSNIVLSGSGGSTSSGSNYTGTNEIYLDEINANTSTANSFSNVEIYFPNYTSSANKSLSADSVYENNATEAYQVFTAGLWSSTAAITSINLAPGAGSFAQYSTFYLYGVSNS